MRALALVILLAACGDDAPTTPPPDAATGVQVTGCGDPALWTAPALTTGTSYPLVGGGACSAGQYPLHEVELQWSADGDDTGADRVCWRVVAASAGSGWSAGQVFSTDAAGARALVRGAGTRLTLDGRVLRDDGTVMVALEPETIALDEIRILDDDATSTIAVMSTNSWAERDALHLWGERVATDEVVDATSSGTGDNAAITSIHRIDSQLVWRSWRLEVGQRMHTDVVLGPGERARIVRGGMAVVVDDELVIMRLIPGEAPVVGRRIDLGQEPAELTGNWYYVTLHLGDELVAYDYQTATRRSVSVEDGILLPVTRDRPPIFFDGASFRQVEYRTESITLDDMHDVTPSADDLAAIGTPRAVYEGVVFGERGLLAASTSPGPRVATYEQLFGGGTLGPLSVDATAYVIRDGDRAALYQARFTDYCGP